MFSPEHGCPRFSGKLRHVEQRVRRGGDGESLLRSAVGARAIGHAGRHGLHVAEPADFTAAEFVRVIWEEL